MKSYSGFPEPADPCIIKGEFLGALIISFCSFCIVATTSFNLVPVLFSKLILRNSSINPSPSSLRPDFKIISLIPSSKHSFKLCSLSKKKFSL